MESNRVAVATVTWARSPAEEVLLGRSLGLLATAGLRVAVADRGTSPALTVTLRRLPGFDIAVVHEGGLVRQVRRSLELAAGLGTPFILYTEPDKALFFESGLHDFVRRALDLEDPGVALAGRTEQSFATFPPMQRYTEGVINHLCGELFGVAGDYSYGPFLMNRALLRRVSELDDRLGWGWRHFMFRAAHRDGFRIVHLTGDHVCPPEQRHEDEDEAERTHRLRQLSQNILGLTGV